jgi:hypothetical protein
MVHLLVQLLLLVGIKILVKIYFIVLLFIFSFGCSGGQTTSGASEAKTNIPTAEYHPNTEPIHGSTNTGPVKLVDSRGPDGIWESDRNKPKPKCERCTN